MNPLPRHRDEWVVIETWLDVIVKTCRGFTNTRREMVVVELQEGHAGSKYLTLGQCRLLIAGRTGLSLKRYARWHAGLLMLYWTFPE